MVSRRWSLQAVVVAIALWNGVANSAPQRERLDRGCVAVPTGDRTAFLSWRLLADDPADVAFDVYRQAGDAPLQRLNAQPLTGPTHWVDEQRDPTRPVTYSVCVPGEVPPTSPTATQDRRCGRSDDRMTIHPGQAIGPCLSVPILTPDGYFPNDASVGDLDGDGQLEIVLHLVGRGRDNSQTGETTAPILDAYRLDGTPLWRINLGRNIREGAHYTQFLVYDFDGDGCAEVACKTADGTTDGMGHVIGDAAADWVSREGRMLGRILDGPEYLTIFDGLTGVELATAGYIPPRGDIRSWGDDYGNRCDRFLACVAYLDGERPSLVMCRGYYERTVLAAWNYRDGRLAHLWTFDSDDGTPGNRDYRGQGNHNLSVGDVDGDGRDEIVYGSCVIDDDGRGLYSTGQGHGDAMHFTDIDPDRPGLEVFKANGDSRHPAGLELRDARSGEQLFRLAVTGRDGVVRACALDIDSRYFGLELWGQGSGVGGLYSARGERIADFAPRTCNMGVWWDGDPLRELLSGVRITKWDWETGRELPLLDAREWGCTSINGTKSNPCLCADILGDWREEMIAPTRDGRELLIFTTTIPTTERRVTLLHDHVYRLGVAWQNVAYNQPAHPGYYLGADRP